MGRAIEAYNEGDYEAALTYFERAHAIAPSSRTLRGLGVVELELGRHRAAAEHLQQALEANQDPLAPAMRDEVDRALTQALRSVSVLELTVTPPAGELRLNGFPVSDGSKHVLDPGDQVVQGSAPGFRTQRLNLRLAAGERRDLHLTLDKEPEPVGPRAPRIVSLVSAGVAAMGIALLITAKVEEKSIEHADSGSWSDYADAYARGPKLYFAGGLLTGVGLAGVLTGVAWQLSAARGRPERRTNLSVSASSVQLSRRF